jgi:GNAT superfamily N-acetyltransferase
MQHSASLSQFVAFTRDLDVKWAMIRQASMSDVAAMNHLRLQVRENVLSDPGLVTEAMTLEAITTLGRGWVFDESGQILGFSIALERDPSIWALFVHPGQERRGIGHELLKAAVNWLWSGGARRIWLNTDPGTRAERFYRKRGWQEAGFNEKGEILLELRHPGGEPDE